MRSSIQRPASPWTAAAGHLPAAPLTAAGGNLGRARELTADRAGLNLVGCYSRTDVVAGVSR
jgi:hypothetical protein